MDGRWEDGGLAKLRSWEAEMGPRCPSESALEIVEASVGGQAGRR
jgi:hypothetical protein